MAFSGTVTHAHHGTLAGGTADKVNFSTGSGFYAYAVTNRGTSDIYFRPNTVGTAVPTVGEANTYFVPKTESNALPKTRIFQSVSQVTYVRLVAADATVQYSVEGLR